MEIIRECTLYNEHITHACSLHLVIEDDAMGCDWILDKYVAYRLSYKSINLYINLPLTQRERKINQLEMSLVRKMGKWESKGVKGGQLRAIDRH